MFVGSNEAQYECTRSGGQSTSLSAAHFYRNKFCCPLRVTEILYISRSSQLSATMMKGAFQAAPGEPDRFVTTTGWSESRHLTATAQRIQVSEHYLKKKHEKEPLSKPKTARTENE
jgi:hypothetical protein